MSLVLLFLAQLLVLCQCEKPPDPSLLQCLDKDIKRELEHPLKDKGSFLLKHLETYNNRLTDCRDMVLMRVHEACEKAAELKKTGGPQFLKAEVDEEKLKKEFDWSEADMGKFRDQFYRAKMAWREVEGEFMSAYRVFKYIQQQDSKERAEMEEYERKRTETMMERRSRNQ